MTEEAQEPGKRQVIPASEILAKIEKGESIDYDGAIIEGDLILSNFSLPTRSVERSRYAKRNRISEVVQLVKSPLTVINSQINGNILFNDSHFKSAISFKGTIFEKNVSFRGSHFEEGADFEDSQFNKAAEFSFSEWGQAYLPRGSLAIGTAVVSPGKFGSTNFRGVQFKGEAIFRGAKFGPVNFDGSLFRGDAKFIMSIFAGYADFEGSHFEAETEFALSKFYGYAFFLDSDFSKKASFGRSQFNEPASFRFSKFAQNAIFSFSEFNSEVDFTESQFEGQVVFHGSKFGGEILTFREAIFKDQKSQEEACRRAKNFLEKRGDREEAGYHFYREMEAKRKQKPWYYRYPEFILIQLIFGYGVHPWRLIFTWLILIVLFAFLYGIGNGIIGASSFFDYLKVSFATAIAPGYIAVIINPGNTGFRLATEYHQAAAIAETIFGTFLWAGFIATFAKKYMK